VSKSERKVVQSTTETHVSRRATFERPPALMSSARRRREAGVVSAAASSGRPSRISSIEASPTVSANSAVNVSATWMGSEMPDDSMRR
jgi:hypothetical protein